MILLLILAIIIPYCLTEKWTVTVYTGKRQFAGTDSNVYIRLFNSQGESTSEYQLTHQNYELEKNELPIRNLFESGAREVFTIYTEDIKSVAKIQIRHNNFPPFQADWLLDQVIVENKPDDVKYVFKCNCWLRGAHPYKTLSNLPDSRPKDKNKTNNSSSKTKRAFVIILIILISLLTGIFCCYNEKRRQQRQSSLPPNATIDPIEREPSLLDTCHPQIPRSSSPSSGPQLWFDTLRRWKNFPHGSSSYSHTRTGQTTAAAALPETSVRIPADEPPAYEDLYPNSNAPVNSASNSNS